MKTKPFKIESEIKATKYKSKGEAIEDHVKNYRSDGISKGKGTKYSADYDRVQFILSCVRPGSYVLDVGCNGGTIGVQLISALNCYVKGIDVVEELVEKAVKRGVFASIGEAEDLSRFNDESFDEVICTEVLEHLYDPIPAVAEAYRVLKKGGRYIITVPAPSSEMCKGLGDYHQQNFTAEMLDSILYSKKDDKQRRFKPNTARGVLIPYSELWCKANVKSEEEFEKVRNTGQWLGVVVEK